MKAHRGPALECLWGGQKWSWNSFGALVATHLANARRRAVGRCAGEARWGSQCADQKNQPFASFEAFATHKLWWGLETSIDELRVYCRKRPDVDQLLMREVGVLPAHGEIGNGRGDNITSTNDIRGTNPTYTLRRLTDLPVFVSWRCERQPRNH